MEIDQRIADLSEKELESLHANAVCLAGSGTVKQQEQANHLLPLVAAALLERSGARAAIQEEQRRAKAKEKAKARAATKAAKHD